MYVEILNNCPVSVSRFMLEIPKVIRRTFFCEIISSSIIISMQHVYEWWVTIDWLQRELKMNYQRFDWEHILFYEKESNNSENEQDINQMP